MTLKEFVEKYLETPDEDKKELIKSCIRKTYIPYADKIDICSNLVEITSHAKLQEEKIFCLKSASKYMLQRLLLINLYTEIEINMEDALTEFDLLEENNLTEKFICSIPKDEYDRFANVLSMTEKDVYENERTVYAIISNITRKIKNVFKTFGKIFKDALAETLNDKDVPDEIKEILYKIRNGVETNAEESNT